MGVRRGELVGHQPCSITLWWLVRVRPAPPRSRLEPEKTRCRPRLKAASHRTSQRRCAGRFGGRKQHCVGAEGPISAAVNLVLALVRQASPLLRCRLSPGSPRVSDEVGWSDSAYSITLWWLVRGCPTRVVGRTPTMFHNTLVVDQA